MPSSHVSLPARSPSPQTVAHSGAAAAGADVPGLTTQLESQPSPLIVLLSSQASAVVRTSSPQMDRLDELDRFNGCEDTYALAPTTSTTCAAKLGCDICGRTRRWTCIEVEGWRRAKNAAAPVV